MSRAKATDVSSPISLFPFIGVLLSTMGALLVVLIAVSRSAHDTAVRNAVSREAAAAAGDEDFKAKLEEVQQFVAKLNGVRAEAEKRLRDDQLRLSHIEDHTRRLKEQLQALQNSVNELVALDGEHYDDRKQAEQEIERLGQLIEARREVVDSLKDENKKKKRSYSIIPYEGPYGTRRRPIYIECRQGEVVLQPEGIRLTAEDFRPPLGAGNPLAAALRAASEYIVRQDGATAPNRETQPYPLILVRPEGILAYYRVRQAIESWDTDFGYELIDNDWKLEFPALNPLLADLEQQAVEQSRTRQQMLMAAAPRAYGPRHTGGGGDGFDLEPEVDDGEDDGGEFSDERGGGGFGNGGGGRYGNGSGGPYATDTAADGEHGAYFGKSGPHGDVAAQGGGNGSERAGSSGAAAGGVVGAPGAGPGTNGFVDSGGTAGGPPAPGSAGVGSLGSAGGGMPQAGGQQPNGSMSVVAGTPMGADGNSRGAPPPLPAGATGASLADGGVGEANLAAMNRSAGNGATGARSAGGRTSSDEPPERVPLDMQMNVQQRIPASTRGQNWAIKGKGPTSVPIRRTIRVVVRGDRIQLQPDSPQDSEKSSSGGEIVLQGSTGAKLDDFVRAVQGRVREWGLAGSGMYWRPVLVLEVEPDGQARADDLTRLLANSGIEVRNAATATRPQEGGSGATR